MAPHLSLARLKSGLSALKKTVQKWRDALTERLKKEEKLSEAEEAWLDNDANHVEEDALMDKLENASDFERGLSRLDSREAGLVEKLKELAGDFGQQVVDKVSNKRKSACFPSSLRLMELKFY
jgi:hypothetical protein